MSSSVHADPPPSRVREPQRYEYDTAEQLGKGGFAICHRATVIDQGRPTGRIVALKIVKSKMEPPKLAQKFVTELQIHSKLSHPNIVQFYRAFSYYSSTYVVLEVCENGSLADMLKKRKFFTMPEIRRFLIQTCGAVKYLHHRNIIHRDLKTGNLFLDSDMNIKVGDFGLAAVLVSQNDLGARRTTMCGTPNYLAPEILDKGGNGHNEKVDLWAIGIIAYTLAVGRAPFHAPKREDIYRKLQNREYSWPEGPIGTEVCEELKDLVGSLLVHEDDRPSPDLIVSHDFFKLGYMPPRLDAKYKTSAPKFVIKAISTSTRARGYTDEWFKICKESGVGEYSPGKMFPLLGGKRIRSVVKDCEKELALGRQPVVPISSDVVYVPYPDRNDWDDTNGGGLSQIAEERESSQEDAAYLAEINANDRKQSVLNKPPTRGNRLGLYKENVAPQPLQTGEALERPKRTRTTQAAIRTVSAQRPPRSSKETKPSALTRAAMGRKSSRSPSEDEVEILDPIPKAVPQPKRKGAERIDSLEPIPTRTAPKSSAPRSFPASTVPSSDPTSVLERVSTFRDNVARALAGRSTPGRKPNNAYRLPFVAKWVDYSRKHGVGYVLEDGNVGCLLSATSRDPVTHVIVRKGFQHLQCLSKDPSSVDKVPMSYLTDCGEDGIQMTELSRERKRTCGILWAKFGKYLCQQYAGNDMEQNELDMPMFVRFYQRLGSVGIWGFADGSFQFNFPDHTKLVLSADGCFCNFTCLSLEATQHLAEFGELPFKYIRQRNVLTCLLRTLLHAQGANGAEIKTLASANLLKEKLDFIVMVVDAWICGGGLGRSSDRLQWTGPQLDDGKKQDWITVGRCGGDSPRGV